MLGTYMATGWSARFGNWITERIEAKNMKLAKDRFTTLYPTLKTVKVYAIKER
jgi:hypothetical protein